MTKRRTKHLGSPVPAELYNAFRVFCRQRGLKHQHVVAQAIRVYLRKHGRPIDDGEEDDEGEESEK